ncbi:endoglucanase 12-like [Phoenix dactylifera]|uniref:Endoglucanase n=1 Tax=Phoenix dactylifera TaxID=42345 RepID=A0A8B7C3M8_PHODC|nr:endoglucanase 12-like [Phoenix dactylifera]
MYSANHWGGPFEIQVDSSTEDEQSRYVDLDRAVLQRQELDTTEQGWLLRPRDAEKKSKYVDLGCILCKWETLRWVIWSALIGFVVVGIPVIVSKTLPKHREPISPPDNYTVALHMALKFFDAQKSGRLPKNNDVLWRGNSGLEDGIGFTELKGGLVGGYYDSGNNIKFHFPMAFSMTLLSWSVIEYSHKYKAIGEYDHIRDIIKWGTDYLLLTFNSSATTINKIYSQVGAAQKGSTSSDDEYCWQRPEDMNYARPVQTSTSAPDLGSEVASALAAASIVFNDNTAYSKRLMNAARTVYKFARESGQQTPYSQGNQFIEPFYNSTGYWDEFMWGAAWMYYATGNYSYLSFATDSSLAKNAGSTIQKPDSSVFSWDNKLLGAELLLSRIRIYLDLGFPYEEMLRAYHNTTERSMCSFLHDFHVFNWTKGGLIQLNHGQPQPLQYAANAAYLASLYADYLNTSNIPGWYCGPYFMNSSTLYGFAASQVDYILGNNPKKISYMVGYGENYPTQVHHRGASIPHDGAAYTCTAGWKWRDKKSSNPNVITGAMVGGPDRFDGFSDVRNNKIYTEPTLAGNAGLVAALVSLTSSGGDHIDKNTIFSSVQRLDSYPPPLPVWKP